MGVMNPLTDLHEVLDVTPGFSQLTDLPAPGTNALMRSTTDRAMDDTLLGRGWAAFVADGASSPMNVAASGPCIHESMPEEAQEMLLSRFVYDPERPKNPLRLIMAFGDSFGEIASDGREALLGLDGNYASVNAWRMTLAPLARPVDGCGYALYATVPLLLRDNASGRLRTVLAHVDIAKVELHHEVGMVHFVAVDRPVATHFGFAWRPSELAALFESSEENLYDLYTYLAPQRTIDTRH
jgi:hypothetical protein